MSLRSTTALLPTCLADRIGRKPDKESGPAQILPAAPYGVVPLKVQRCAVCADWRYWDEGAVPVNTGVEDYGCYARVRFLRPGLGGGTGGVKSRSCPSKRTRERPV
jgi:hypothetical protein